MNNFLKNLPWPLPIQIFDFAKDGNTDLVIINKNIILKPRIVGEEIHLMKFIIKIKRLDWDKIKIIFPLKFYVEYAEI